MNIDSPIIPAPLHNASPAELMISPEVKFLRDSDVAILLRKILATQESILALLRDVTCNRSQWHITGR